MAETETLYSVDYIIGELPDIDRKSIGNMVLRNYLAGNNMDEDSLVFGMKTFVLSITMTLRNLLKRYKESGDKKYMNSLGLLTKI